MQQRVFNTALFIFTVIIGGALLAGCGGGSSSSKNSNVVAQVTLAPASLSLEAGQVSDPLSVKAFNSSGGPVTTTFSFNSANPTLATISPGGLVCAGVWDSTFVTCNGTTASGAPLSGLTTITATAAGVTSAPVTISVHPHTTSVTVEPVAAGTCFSGEQTHQFVAHACSSAVTPPDTTGPCAPNSKEITDQIGAFTWSSSSPQVATVDANGLATANIAGISGIVARVGNTSSPATNFRSCMPVSIRLHVPGDPAGQPTVSATLNITDTKVLEADITDENGKVVNNAPGISVLSNNTAVATVSGTTVTAQSPGGAGILAACLPPSCGIGLNQPVYGNLFSINVNGASPATTVYVASKDLAQVSTIIPIDTSKTPPVAGTQITLPGHPNSFIFDAAGNKAYIGTDGGLVTLDPTANTVTLIAPEAVGTVLAISPDGNHAIVSNAPNEPGNVLDHRLRFFDATNNTLQTFIIHNTVAAAFTPDGSKAYIGATDGNVYVFSPFATLRTLSPGGSFSSVVSLPSGPFAFLANTASLDAFNVCDNSPATAAPTNSAPKLLSSVLSKDQIVALDTTGVNIETVTISGPSTGFCPPTLSYNDEFIDFLVGPITANQLIVPGNAAHIVVLPQGENLIHTAVPGLGAGLVHLAAGATEALSGGMTLDGNTLWVGVQGDHTLHRINLLTLTDEFQIQPNANSAGSTPDLVVVRPH